MTKTELLQVRDAMKRLIATDEAHSTLHAADGDDVARMIEYADAFDNARATIALLDADLARVVEPVGITSTMPGTTGFTMACFKAADVPAGTNIYATPQDAEAPELLEALKDAYPYVDNSHLRNRIGGVIAKASGVAE